MNYTVGIGIGIGRMLQTDAAPIGSIDVLGAIKALIIVKMAIRNTFASIPLRSMEFEPAFQCYA